jgi:hypothetical protein
LSLLIGGLGGLGVLLIFLILGMADKRAAETASSGTNQGSGSRVASSESTADDRTGESTQAGADNGPAHGVAIVGRLAACPEQTRGNQKTTDCPSSFSDPHGSIPFDAGHPTRPRRSRTPQKSQSSKWGRLLEHV